MSKKVKELEGELKRHQDAINTLRKKIKDKKAEEKDDSKM